MEIKEKERYEIDNKYKWDLSIMYKDEQSWEMDYNELDKKIKTFSKFKGILSSNSNNLLDALKEKDNINRVFEKLASYAFRKSDEDTRKANSTRLKSKIVSLGAEFGEISSFFETELIQIGDTKIKTFINENNSIKPYAHYLENILRFKDHTLSLEEEKIIASASEILSSPSNIFTKLNNADIKFTNIIDEKGNVIELSKGNYSIFIASRNREVRKSAFLSLYKSYEEHKNTFAETLIGDIKGNYFISKNRKFIDPLEMSFFYNKIDTKVYDNVIEVVHNNLDKMYRYVKMKNGF
jgi:oligoendopeptidase F